ncbi:uncharacterized protein LOC131025067 [Salvia miltiorrhiza]|uniref:uncharacterized protein LOC131025067 n=1 Tax=Salvia miltiorrhiza TaxID=226208 RepID=UPI0025AB6052|nr:uncharacterized protein LOC131025067 [Salvia miltiorrhiza]
MKRQSGNREKEKCEVKKVNRKKIKSTAASDEVAAEKVAGEERKAAAEEWFSWWSGVDEEMPWATSWIPFWEVEAYDALYGDVLWDYDIWNLKGLAPNPS